MVYYPDRCDLMAYQESQVAKYADAENKVSGRRTSNTSHGVTACFQAKSGQNKIPRTDSFDSITSLEDFDFFENVPPAALESEETPTLTPLEMLHKLREQKETRWKRRVSFFIRFLAFAKRISGLRLLAAKLKLSKKDIRPSENDHDDISWYGTGSSVNSSRSLLLRSDAGRSGRLRIENDYKLRYSRERVFEEVRKRNKEANRLRGYSEQFVNVDDEDELEDDCDECSSDFSEGAFKTRWNPTKVL